MKKFTVTVQADIDIEFDETSEEFKELFENYLKYFNPDCDYELFASSIVQFISRYGVDEFIEGVGYVKHNGNNQTIWDREGYTEKLGCINVIVDTDLNNKVDFEILQVEEIN